jgi:two-component sensor histidine kinase
MRWQDEGEGSGTGVEPGAGELPRNPELLAPALAEADPDALEHLHRLMGWWGMLADLSLADLLLLLPVAGSGGSRFLIYGQMRPGTNQTLHREDLVGRVIDAEERPHAYRSWQLGEIVEGELGRRVGVDSARVQCIPVRSRGSLIAILCRESHEGWRKTGELEKVYVELFDRFASMIVEGVFPFEADEVATDDAPRVSDGIMVLDLDGRVSFTSPNAISALHRMGIYSDLVGARLEDLGVNQSAVARSFRSKVPVIEEVERRPDVIVLLRCVPFLRGGAVSGGLVLLRDVTDLRRRDRLLLSKDAAIREVHHRVKNNLQTISSLLGLQQRRLTSDEGRDALREAETRIRSIAVVHEILSREASDQVRFEEIVRSLVRMAEESVVAPHPVEIRVEGRIGEVPADVATPLAVVLTELLQNAVEHAYDYGEGPVPARDAGLVRLVMCRGPGSLTVEVEDDGRGLPPGFDMTSTESLGLLIVRDLVTSQLRGRIDMRGGEGGTVVRLELPVSELTGAG